MSLTYFLNDFEMVPVAPITSGITLAFTFHMRWISIVRSLYFKIFSASFDVTTSYNSVDRAAWLGKVTSQRHA
jgi:hypothetical protein